MGNSRRPFSRWEVLQVDGMWIRPEGKGVVIEMTVNGAAKLARCLQLAGSGKGDAELRNNFLDELIVVGRYARSRLRAESVQDAKEEAIGLLEEFC